MKKNFKNEFKKQIKLAIAAAVGFLIVFAWRDFILKITGETLNKFLELNPISSALLISIIITVIGILIIVISSKILK